MSDIHKAGAAQRFSLARRLKSFSCAFAGLRFMLRTQHNAWVHALATLAVIGLGAWCGVSAADWRWLVAAIAMVWTAEAINTAVEYVCDVVSPAFHPAVRHAKDIAAGGVLIAALAAAVLGTLTFWPYFS